MPATPRCVSEDQKWENGKHLYYSKIVLCVYCVIWMWIMLINRRNTIESIRSMQTILISICKNRQTKCERWTVILMYSASATQDVRYADLQNCYYSIRNQQWVCLCGPNVIVKGYAVSIGHHRCLRVFPAWKFECWENCTRSSIILIKHSNQDTSVKCRIVR